MGLCTRCGKEQTFFKMCWKCQEENDLEQRQQAIRDNDESSIYYDTSSDKYIICPYCGNYFEDDAGDPFTDGSTWECDECGKEFTIDVEWTVSYSTRKMED